MDLAGFLGRFAAPPEFSVGGLESALETASRQCDDFCHRQFFTTQATRVFDGTGRTPTGESLLNWSTQQLASLAFSFIRIPDLIAATTVKLDPLSQRTWPVTLNPATDYYLLNEGGDNQDAPPFDRFQLDVFNTTAGYNTFPSRPRVLQIAGSWGYPSQMLPVSGITMTVADGTTDEMTTSADASTRLAQGMTLLLGTEQVYVTGGSGVDWTILRGMNGTTAAAHASVLAQRFAYAAQVAQATLLQTSNLLHLQLVDRLVVEPDDSSQFTHWSTQLCEQAQAVLDPLVRRFV